MNIDREELVRQAKRGKAEAFAALYEDIYMDLYRFAFYTLKQPQDAEDAVSETVTTAFEKIRTLKKAEAFKSWMFQILVNQCRKKLNRKSRDQELKPEKEPYSETDPSLPLSLREAFGQLSGQERMMIALSVFGGYRSNEIGEQMQLPAATVRSKMSRAYGKLRKFLGEEESK